MTECAICGRTRRGYLTEHGHLCSRCYWKARRGLIDPAMLIAARQATQARFAAELANDTFFDRFKD